MFPKTSIVAALAGIFTFAAASLPTTLIISVIDATTGVTLGSLNGYGNFSSPGPDYPFYSEVATGEYSTIYGYGQCTVGDFLDCYGGSGAGVDFFELDDGNLALEGTDGSWSVAATTGTGGGLNPFGLSYGIPVYLGDAAAIPVTLSIASASG